jgi:hypothetical protein
MRSANKRKLSGRFLNTRMKRRSRGVSAPAPVQEPVSTLEPAPKPEFSILKQPE